MRDTDCQYDKRQGRERESGLWHSSTSSIFKPLIGGLQIRPELQVTINSCPQMHCVLSVWTFHVQHTHCWGSNFLTGAVDCSKVWMSQKARIQTSTLGAKRKMSISMKTEIYEVQNSDAKSVSAWREWISWHFVNSNTGCSLIFGNLLALNWWHLKIFDEERETERKRNCQHQQSSFLIHQKSYFWTVINSYLTPSATLICLILFSHAFHLPWKFLSLHTTVPAVTALIGLLSILALMVVLCMSNRLWDGNAWGSWTFITVSVWKINQTKDTSGFWCALFL